MNYLVKVDGIDFNVKPYQIISIFDDNIIFEYLLESLIIIRKTGIFISLQ
jgi:hypothetical protein